jgi:hypothetical protein
MKNDFHTVQRLLQQVLIGNTALNEIDPAANLVDVFTMTGGQVVEHTNSRAAREQCGRDM